MKKILYSAFLVITSMSLLNAQIDRTKAPAAGPAPKVQIGKYESFTLKNGLTVFVVEDHKTPSVSISLFLENDPVLQKDKAGYVEIAGQLISRGTKNRTKEQIQDEIDFIGASFNTNENGFYAQGLKKHIHKVLDIATDVLYNPTFPAEEFDNIMSMIKTGVASVENSPSQVLNNLQAKIVYGNNHPYGDVLTPKTLNNITLDDVKEYYAKYYIPNSAYLVFVGDINKTEATDLANKYFANWAKGTPVKAKYPTPQLPTTSQIHMFDRPNSSQTSILFTYPVNYKIGDPDFFKTRLIVEILGGSGFQGRLFQNLREKHAFTYGAYASISPDRLVGVFEANAEVKAIKTDSAIYQFIYELNRMSNQGVTAEELEATKKEMTGRFALSLEQPRTIANFAVNTARYKLPKNYYENYLTNLNAVTLEEANDAAKRYVLPFNYNLILVGDRSLFETRILKYDSDQTIQFYDAFGAKKLSRLQEMPSDVTADNVLENYIKAVGGLDNLNGIQDITKKSQATLGANVFMKEEIGKDNQKFMSSITFRDNVLQKEIFDGTKGTVETAQAGKKAMTAEEIGNAKIDAVFFVETKYKEVGLQIKAEGIDIIDESKFYVIRFTKADGNYTRCWYNINTGLKAQSISYFKDDEGKFQSVKTLYSDYAKVQNVLFPHVEGVDFGGGAIIEFIVNSIELNTNVSDNVFSN